MNISPFPVRSKAGLWAPILIEAPPDTATNEATFHSWLKTNGEELHQQLIEHGAILLRGFPVQTAEAFEAALDQTRYQNMPYVGGAAPRSQVTASRIVTANESPATEKIPFHHEMAQVPNPPGYIYFWCDIAPTKDGSTSLLNSAEICDVLFDLDRDFAEKLEAQGVSYIRVMPEVTDAASPIGRSWQETFKAINRAEAEAEMTRAGMSWEWLDNGNLKTQTRVLPAIRTDAETGRKVFFNSVVAVYTGWDDSRNVGREAVVLADGSTMPEDTMAKLVAAMEERCVNFPWQHGDLLLINNYTVLHARQPYEGDRRILASIAYK